jgi:hypothetical protein
MIHVMEHKAYAVTVSLHTVAGHSAQMWQCPYAPGVFRTWAQLRARMITMMYRAHSKYP